MSQKLKCHQSANVIKTEMSPIRKWHRNAIVTETKISPKHKCHQNANATKIQMSQTCKCHQNENENHNGQQKSNMKRKKNLPKGSTTTRSPYLVHINLNKLPGHGSSDPDLLSHIWVITPRAANDS